MVDFPLSCSFSGGYVLHLAWVLPKDWFTVDPMKVKCLKVPTGKICDDYFFPL